MNSLIHNLRLIYQDGLDYFLQYLRSKKHAVLSSHEILEYFKQFCQETSQKSFYKNETLKHLVEYSQELLIQHPHYIFAHRFPICKWHFFEIDVDQALIKPIHQKQFLKFKESLSKEDALNTLELDFSCIQGKPFDSTQSATVRIPNIESAGNGFEFLTNYLSHQFFTTKQLKHSRTWNQKFFEFLKSHHFQHQSLLLKEDIPSIDALYDALAKSNIMLKKHSKDTPYSQLKEELESIGILAGWGNTNNQIQTSLKHLYNLFKWSTARDLIFLIRHIPCIFKIVIFSIHGYFSQYNVLGLADTGGQVIYILNQVQALEKLLVKRFEEQGLLDIKPQILILTRLIPNSPGTICNTEIEKVDGTRYSQIVRIPFRDENGDVVQDWVSRFQIWPYLEQFAQESKSVILNKMGSKPNLIVGNYSDGNLVATLTAKDLNVTQGIIAHALEKTKYPLSDFNWKAYEKEYHFSSQLTADLISMNASDFIITSSQNEIIGQKKSVGQYESYSFFSFPGLYNAYNAIDIHDPKFNVIPPGNNPDTFFYYTKKERRKSAEQKKILHMIYDEQGKNAFGQFENTKKPIIFSMARLEKIKNITSLVKWYGKSKELQKLANLLIVSGHVYIGDHVKDSEERTQIEIMHELIQTYHLKDKIRWLGALLDYSLSGELYRCVADTQGIFVQPALFEAFGLTVIEAMQCGLPTFATAYGGPAEIVENEISGFHLNVHNENESIQTLLNFFKRTHQDASHWHFISQRGAERVQEHYNWEVYASKFLDVTSLHRYWNLFNPNKHASNQYYSHLIYELKLKHMLKNQHSAYLHEKE